MIKGGYQILDLSGRNFTVGQSQIFPGVYEMLESTRKVILVSGLEVNGLEYRDAFVDFRAEGGAYIGYMYDVRINIGNSGDGNDPITIENV